jgi:hypothetical protein
MKQFALRRCLTQFRTPYVADGDALEVKVACQDTEGKLEI